VHRSRASSSTDEISALVLDPGYSDTRAGFAGEDAPRSVFPSSYGYLDRGELPPHRILGDDGLAPRPGLEIRNYLNHDSVVEDWDTATRMWENMLVRSLHGVRQPLPRRNRARTANGAAAANGSGDGASGSKDNEGDVAMGDGAGDAAVVAAPGAAGTDNNITAKVEDEDDEQEPTVLEESPLMMSEAPWNPTKAREKTAEIIMEDWSCPAFWLSRTPILAAFAAGRATALVIDVGAANTSVAALHDGMVLKKSIQRSPIGGIWLSSQIRSMLSAQTPKVDIVPTYRVEAKRPVDAGAPPQALLRDFGFPIHDSFHAYKEEGTLLHFKESVVEVWHQGGRYLEHPSNEEYVSGQPGPVFEFPDGRNQMWREQRYRVAEGMFDAEAQYPAAAGAAPGALPFDAITPAQTVPDLVRAAVNAVDTDLRGNLLANVVVTGGTSLVRGFTERLHTELSSMYPAMRIRVQAAGPTSERRFGAWLGGSILSSLGTFHQMWISRKEYEENGPNIVEKRCK
jgi:actin-related protein 4